MCRLVEYLRVLITTIQAWLAVWVYRHVAKLDHPDCHLYTHHRSFWVRTAKFDRCFCLSSILYTKSSFHLCFPTGPEAFWEWASYTSSLDFASQRLFQPFEHLPLSLGVRSAEFQSGRWHQSSGKLKQKNQEFRSLRKYYSFYNPFSCRNAEN